MKILFFLHFLVCITACVGLSPAPVSNLGSDYEEIVRGSYRGSYYTVQKGDTLYYIAYVTGKDVSEVISANNIVSPYIIFPGQKLNIWQKKYTSPTYGKKTAVPIKSADTIVTAVTAPVPTTVLSSNSTKNNQKSAPKHNSGSLFQNKKLVEEQKAKEYSLSVMKNRPDVNRSTNKPAGLNKKVSWKWPTQGIIVSGFSSSELGNKGIDISGKRGQSIEASADGKVVYTGNALRGYGKLVIIKHDDDYLSAYAHNDHIFVSERQSVKKGQKISSMGRSGTNNVRLHFEIRYKGKSVNPLRYLPKR
ncbi:peptidoglycan DD-metalloendopeptidase family protein [Candidatus Enterovibrio escicola]|uniref:peptidoglycan DD-metalloendopeptidase family protein n=1 Tax=Candidatus Enterovibrio escicola TaxID=1927127 RepID=UPI001237F746|nr:peptidoglycan DD-metalloendopeptidase family protein [Candidatus Enterovibrio escacola]